MRPFLWTIVLPGLLLILNLTNALAEPGGTREQLQMPHCLASKLSSKYPVLARDKDFQILDVPSADLDKLARAADRVHCGRFVNVTSALGDKTRQARIHAANFLLSTPKQTSALASAPGPEYSIGQAARVTQVFNAIRQQNILDTLKSLTSFYNRSASSKSGVQAANWLGSTFDKLANHSGREDVDSWFVPTGPLYQQASLVTVIGKNNKAPAIVLGAHMDTLGGRMPGADDDGSGSACLMEMARVLLNSKLEFKRPVYFIWYAAEERGLVGSQYVVADFLKKGLPVQAVLQFDMTGFRHDPKDPTLWIYKDYTDPDLNNYLAELIETYIGVPVGESACGYGCSDHLSWNKAGIPAAFPHEADFDTSNPRIHSTRDTMTWLIPEHMVNFTKLGLAFVVETAT